MSSPGGATWRSGYAAVCKTKKPDSAEIADTIAAQALPLIPDQRCQCRLALKLAPPIGS
jgi:hypothetical protein